MVDITPTLFIGLGGTGMEVLTAVRRMFYERYGRFEVPCIEYLHVDTDRRQKRSKFFPPDHIADAIALRPGESVYTKVGPESVADYFAHPDTYPHLFRWLSRSALKFGPAAITEGAGQYRPFGRLALFHAYKDIKKAIHSKLNRIASDGTIQQVNREDPVFEVQPTDRAVKVFIVSSIAGGTGAGMCLDIPYIVRDVARETAGELGLVVGFLVMPDVYVHAEDVGDLTPDEKRKMQANGYAALKELEYYSRLGTVGEQRLRRFADSAEREATFRVQWALDEPERVFHELPFDICNLIGNANSGGIDLGSVRDVVEMTAERIYLDFDEGGFTAQREQREANIRQTYSQNYPVTYKDDAGHVVYSNPFSCRFSSFAITKVYLDRMRLRHAGCYELAIQLVAGLASGVDVGDATYRDYTRAREAALGELPFALDKLEASLTGRVFDQIAGECAKPSAADYATLKDDLRQTAEPGSGRDFKKIGSTLAGFMKRQLDGFKAWLDTTMDAGPESIGIERLIAFLRGLADKAHADCRRAEAAPPPADGPLGDRVAKLREAESLPAFPAGLRRYATTRLQASCAAEAQAFAKAAVQRLVGVHAAKGYLEPARGLLAAAVADLERARAKLLDLVERKDDQAQVHGLAHHRDELALRIRESPRNLLLSRGVDLAAEVRRALAPSGDAGVFHARMAELKTKLRSAITKLDPNVKRIVDYGGPSHTVHFGDLKTAIVELAYQGLEGFLGDRSAAAELFRQFSAEDARKHLERRMQACRPFVRLDQPFLVNWMKDRMTPIRYCGYDMVQNRQVDIDRAISEGEQKFQPVTHDRDAVLFLHILDGLPLCSIDQVKGFRDAYKRLQEDPRSTNASYHLDKNSAKFPEITVQSREEALADVALMKGVLAGAILRLVRWNASSASFVYRYSDASGVLAQEQTVGCGASLGQILETFKEKPELARHLEADRNRWYADRLHEPTGVWPLVRLRLVLSYYARFVFQKPKAVAGDERTSSAPTIESLVVARLAEELDQVLRNHDHYATAAVQEYVVGWKHWIEVFARFDGAPGQEVLVLRETDATDDEALAVVRHHNRAVLGRDALELTRLAPLNPLDEDPTPPESWRAHWAGRGAPAPRAAAPSADHFNPLGRGAVGPAPVSRPPTPAVAPVAAAPVVAMPTPVAPTAPIEAQPAAPVGDDAAWAQPVEDEPDPFAGL